MKRRILQFDLHGLADWPTVDPNALEPERKTELLDRMAAIKRYARGATLEETLAGTSIHRVQLYRLIRRCLATHEDGRINGFRGLLPFLRLKSYERLKTVKATNTSRRSGSAGAMTQLLSRYDSLGAWLERQIAQGSVYIDERQRLSGLRAVHLAFLNECRALGLTTRDYPLSAERQGLRSISLEIRRMMSSSFAKAARSAGAHRVAPMWSNQDESDLPARRPFEVCEFDGHKMDLRLHVNYTDDAHVQETLVINRVWLLVVLEVFSRCVLGWNLVLAPEYNRHDVMRTMAHALLPQRKRTRFSIPGLAYSAQAGLVSEVVPALDGACWERLRFDNARANLAAQSIELLSQIVGCICEAGPVGKPTERPYVERFFGTIESHLAHRLPGTTGSHTRDVRRQITDQRSNAHLAVTFDELNELLEVTIAEYNGTPHDSLGGRAPLEMLARTIDQHRDRVRVLSEPFRRQTHLLYPHLDRIVKGNARAGLRPYVNLFDVRYSSRTLQGAVDLIGKPLRVYYDPEDLRVVHVYLPDGQEIGALNATRPWHRTKHSLRLRQEIMRLRRLRKLHFSQSADPVRVYLDYKRSRTQRKERSRASHRDAEAARALTRVASSHAASSDASPLASTPPDPDHFPIVKPRTLNRIGKGQITKTSKS